MCLSSINILLAYLTSGVKVIENLIDWSVDYVQLLHKISLAFAQ